jgi:hypothetical protein
MVGSPVRGANACGFIENWPLRGVVMTGGFTVARAGSCVREWRICGVERAIVGIDARIPGEGCRFQCMANTRICHPNFTKILIQIVRIAKRCARRNTVNQGLNLMYRANAWRSACSTTQHQPRRVCDRVRIKKLGEFAFDFFNIVLKIGSSIQNGYEILEKLSRCCTLKSNRKITQPT